MMRRLGGTLVAVIVAVIATLVPAAAPVARADEGLQWETTATYTFDSPAGVVHVQVEVTLTAQQPGYYFTGVSLPVANDAVNVTATGDGAPVNLTLAATDSEFFQQADIDFPRNLFNGQSLDLVVTYDLTGEAPRSEDPERINPAYASFYAFGVGDPGLTTVRVIIPEAFEFDSFGEQADVVETREVGYRVLTAAALADPGSWTLFVSARNDDALVSRTGTAGDVAFDVRAWPNDAEWATFADQTITTGLPVLTELVGLPWPIDGTLEVRETITPYLYGYAGWFDGKTGDIEVGEDLDPLVMLHELSHAWFNDELFDARWINEGMAQAISNRAFAEIGGIPDDPAPIDHGAPGALQLDGWGSVPLDDAAQDATEDFGYHASWFVIDALADEIGDEAMRAIIAAAANGTNPYQATVPLAGTSTGGASWSELLDLAEEVGGSTGFAQLLRDHVLLPATAVLLDERAAARAAFDGLEVAGAGWEVPGGVRESMADWGFAAATEQIGAATAILAIRDEVARKATELALTPPASTEAAYEEAGAQDDDTLAELADVRADLEAQLLALADLFEVDGARVEAEAHIAGLDLTADLDPYLDPARDAFEAGELGTVMDLAGDGATEISEWVAAAELLATTAAAVEEPRGVIENLGLRGTDLDGMLDDARQAFDAGDRERATELARDVQAALDDASSRGVQRLVIGLVVVVVLLALVALLVVVRRRRRAARSRRGGEQAVGEVVGGEEELDAQLVEGDVAWRPEAGERGEQAEPPAAEVEDER